MKDSNLNPLKNLVFAPSTFLVFGLLLVCRPLSAQTVVVAEEEAKPYSLDPEGGGLRARGAQKNPSQYTSTYVLVYHGPNGQIQGSSFSSSRLEKKILEEFSFPSLNFIFSAASRLMTDDNFEPGKVDAVGSRTELRKLNANVRVRGLDANKKPLLPPQSPKASPQEPALTVERDIRNPDDAPVIVLAISPSESQYRMGQSDVTKVMDSVNVFTRFMGPLGGLSSGVTAVFKNFFKTKDTPTQVAYLSGEEEFGWNWIDAENFGIEGIHQCSALLRVRKEVKYLQVHVDVVTDWRRFGAWVKPVDFILTLPAAESAP